MARPGPKARFMPASGTVWRDEKVEAWAAWEKRFGGPISTEARNEIEHVLFGGRIGRARYPGIPLPQFFKMIERHHRGKYQHEVERQAILQTGGDVSRLFRELRNPKTRDDLTIQVETEERAVIPQLAEVFRREGLPVSCSTRQFKEGEKGYPDATAFEAFCIAYVICGDPASSSDRRRVGTALTQGADSKRK